MAVVVPNVVRLAFRGLWTNQEPIVNVLHAHITGQGITSRTQAVDETLPDMAQNFQTQLVGPQFLNNYTFVGIDWVDLDSLEGRTGFEPPFPGAPTQGTRTTVASPPNVCAVAQKLSNDRTRGRRNGRWYLPVVSEDSSDENGVITTTYRTSLTNSLNNFRTNVNQDGGTDGRNVRIGVVSDPAALPAAFLELTSWSVRALVGTQRRRVAG